LPAFGLAERPGLTDPNRIADAAIVARVVHVELVGLSNDLAIQRMRLEVIHRHHNSLVHLIADHPPPLIFPSSFGHYHAPYVKNKEQRTEVACHTLLHLCSLTFVLSTHNPSSRSRRIVLMRAISRFTIRGRPVAVSLPIFCWKRRLKSSSWFSLICACSFSSSRLRSSSGFIRRPPLPLVQ